MSGQREVRITRTPEGNLRVAHCDESGRETQYVYYSFTDKDSIYGEVRDCLMPLPPPDPKAKAAEDLLKAIMGVLDTAAPGLGRDFARLLNEHLSKEAP